MLCFPLFFIADIFLNKEISLMRKDLFKVIAALEKQLRVMNGTLAIIAKRLEKKIILFTLDLPNFNKQPSHAQDKNNSYNPTKYFIICHFHSKN